MGRSATAASNERGRGNERAERAKRDRERERENREGEERERQVRRGRGRCTCSLVRISSTESPALRTLLASFARLDPDPTSGKAGRRRALRARAPHRGHRPHTA